MEAVIERTILSHLVFNEDYARQVVPHLKPEYFHQNSDKVVYELVDEFFGKYNALPTKEALLIELKTVMGLTEGDYQAARNMIDGLSAEKTELQWLVDSTEQFVRDKAIYNGVNKSIGIISGSDKTLGKDSIPDILSEALSVAFDKRVGHDYFEDFGSRYEFYHRVDNRIKFGVETLNQITKGGLPRKTLTVFMAPTGVGKSLIMCHLAAMNYLDGLNVLYITGEMAEERIAERLDANLLDVTLDDLVKMSREVYEKRIKDVRSKTPGRLIIKEYPTASSHVGHFKSLIKELKLKKNFVPDIIYVDYINIFASSRFKAGATVSSYTMIKAIAEELRGLAVEHNLPVITATQVNRGGMNNSDLELTDTSESVGLPFTVDLMLGVMTNEELEQLGQLLFKQLKNRFGDPATMKRFVVGVDKPKMRLYDLGDRATSGVVKSLKEEDEPVFDRTAAGRESRQLKNKLRDMLR
jgi:archaellum biogenesis ATPase FlaH